MLKWNRILPLFVHSASLVSPSNAAAAGGRGGGPQNVGSSSNRAGAGAAAAPAHKERNIIIDYADDEDEDEEDDSSKARLAPAMVRVVVRYLRVNVSLMHSLPCSHLPETTSLVSRCVYASVR